MRNGMWRAALTAALALNSFSAAADSSAAAPRAGRHTDDNAGAESRASRQRRELVRKIVARALRVDTRKVLPEARFVEDLGGHSLSLAECRFKIEEAFGLEIPDAEAQKLTRVRDVLGYVETHVKGSQ